ncbi:Zerumbone synthase [Nymphaea thermarum]|nr:Zerumbone synthase [Nymphaea thermarum]
MAQAGSILSLGVRAAPWYPVPGPVRARGFRALDRRQLCALSRPWRRHRRRTAGLPPSPSTSSPPPAHLMAVFTSRRSRPQRSSYTIHSFLYSHCDVTTAVDLALARFGRLNIMVNNEGVSGAGDCHDIRKVDLGGFQRDFAVNVDGIFSGQSARPG